MANEFVVKNGLIVSGSANIQNSVTAQSFTGSLSGSIAAPGSDTQVLLNNGGTIGATSTLVVSASRVGVGFPNPSALLHISSSTDSLLRVDSPVSASLLYVSASGNVGIGTLGPTARFHIYQKSSATDPDPAPGISHLIDSSGSFIVNESGSFVGVEDLSYRDGAAFRIDVLPQYNSVLYVSSSRVGINTDNPLYELNVTGSTSTDFLYAPYTSSKVGIGNTNPLASLHILENSSPYNNIPSAREFLLDGSGDYIVTEENVPLLVQDNTDYTGTALKVDSMTGNLNVLYVSGSRVGINKAAPGASLDVKGNVLVSGSLTVSGSSTFTNIGPAVFSGSVTISGSTSMTGSLNVTGSILNNGVNIQSLSIAYAIALG